MAFKFMNTLKFTLALGLVFTVVILVTTPPLAAQSIVTGDLTGVVTDSSGAAVAGAEGRGRRRRGCRGCRRGSRGSCR